MTLRPQPAVWFELVLARDDLLRGLLVLAHTQSIELPVNGQAGSPDAFAEALTVALAPFNALLATHSEDLPSPQPVTEAQDDLLSQTHHAIERLAQWQRAAEPLLARRHALSSMEAQLATCLALARQAAAMEFELARLDHAGPVLAAAFVWFQERVPSQAFPEAVLFVPFPEGPQAAGLLLFPRAQQTMVTQHLGAAKGKLIPLPGEWQGGNEAIIAALEEQRAGVLADLDAARTALQQLHVQYDVGRQLGWLIEMDWVLDQLPAFRLETVTAYTAGWSALPDAEALNSLLACTAVRGIAQEAPPPRDAVAPMLLHNPWWAQPFEIFIRAWGMPGPAEADPSWLLAIFAPLLFGYMFGDIGQGLVLILLGAALQRHYPLARLLLPGGALAMLFGLLYGSVFSMHGLVAPLWIDPLRAPLLILSVPLGGGFVLLSIGLLLGALEAWWQKRTVSWLYTELGLLLAYWGGGWVLVHPTGSYLLIFGLLWHFAGYWRCRPGRQAILAALSSLLEQGMQLVVNTLSFVRVGAFALAHAGLSMAVVSLAHASGSHPAYVLVLAIGNAAILLLETMVVSIQTTRLILLEFFLRFAAVHGRRLKPLSLPLLMLPGRPGNEKV